MALTFAPARSRRAGRSTGRPGGVVIVLPRMTNTAGIPAARLGAPAAGAPGSRVRAVRSGAVMVDGYVRAPPPNAWTANPAAIDRGLIRRWAIDVGWHVRCLFEEPASTGLGDSRSRLRAALERVESRESDGLVVARLRHLGRSLEEAVDAIERIEAAGGRFVSVCDGIDLGTPAGRLVLRVLLSVLEW